MEKILGPTGRLLVGAVFICLLISLNAAASEQSPSLPDLQKELKVSQSGAFNHSPREWLVRPSHTSGLPLGFSSSKEKIALNESHSMVQVSDLKVMNAVKERDIIYDGEQYGDPETQGVANFLDVAVTGQEKAKKTWPGERWEDNYIDEIVDNALNTSMKNEEKNGQMARKSTQLQPIGNNLNIDVAGISVSAINTVQGGSAVATSNIIIKPVQIIICPSEVEEKLK
ncbi:MAG: hypothetical protein ACYDHX_02630 [Methanothrix sp.]